MTSKPQRHLQLDRATYRLLSHESDALAINNPVILSCIVGMVGTLTRLIFGFIKSGHFNERFIIESTVEKVLLNPYTHLQYTVGFWAKAFSESLENCCSGPTSTNIFLSSGAN